MPKALPSLDPKKALALVAWASYADHPAVVCDSFESGEQCYGYQVRLPCGPEFEVYFCLRCERCFGRRKKSNG